MLASGKVIKRNKNAHDRDEITAACLNESQRHLFTGCRNGSIKVQKFLRIHEFKLKLFFVNYQTWNVSNGQLLHVIEPFDELEITGLFYIDKRKLLLSTGWNNAIVSYTNISLEVIR